MSSGGWIKLEKDLLTDPRLMRRALRLAESVRMEVGAGAPEALKSCNGRPLPAVTLVLGALAHLWMIADTHIGDDDVLPLGTHEIDEILGLPGFTELLPQEWLQVIDSDSVKLPGYHVHNGTEAKGKALNRKRVARSRDKQRSTVTPRNGRPLPDLDLDLDLDRDHTRQRTAAAAAAVSRTTATKFPDPSSIPPQVNPTAVRTWLEYRIGIGKRIKPPAWGALYAKFGKLGAHEAQLAAVENSMGNGYTGLFAERPGATNGSAAPRPTRFEQVTAPAGSPAHEDQGFG